MQKEMLVTGDLLDDKGHLIECGYAKKLIKHYDRKKIKAGKLRIKEWDYYLIYNDKFGVAITIADNSYMGLNSITLLDFSKPSEITKSPMKFMTLGKVGLPASSVVGDVGVKGKGYAILIRNNGKVRTITVDMLNFKDGKDFHAEFELTNTPKDSMVIATPFKENKKAFYYNQKIVGFKAKGFVKFGAKKIKFEDSNTRAILDWGRGVWTYKNTWYWGAGSGVVDGHEVGFNIGYGFGDTSSASENMIFYDGVAHKLEKVTFDIPKKDGQDDFMSAWTFSSDDGRFDMDFVPIIDRNSFTNAGIISSNQHQVFGRFSGKMVLDDGREVVLNDFLAFAEKVVNKW